MRSRVTGVAATALSVVLSACAVNAQPRIDLDVSPATVFTTVPFEVGEAYTLGETGVPPEVPRPVRITAIEVIHSQGIEIIGIGAVEPNPDGIGLVPGWPPQGFLFARAPDLFAVRWEGPVNSVVGIRTTEAKSGLRGVEVRWVDANGTAGSRTFDIAVVTCAPAACELDVDVSDLLLPELGLVR